MIRINIFFLLCMLVAISSCNKIDNYDAPNGNIYGKLTDIITNEGFQTEQPNGFLMKLFEKGGSLNSPISFHGKPDGTFENALIFQNEYKVIPSEGAFFPLDTAIVQVGDRTEVNFEVIPFLSLTNVSVTASPGKIAVSYRIERSKISDKIVEREVLVSKIPTVNSVVFDFRNSTDLSGIADQEILSSPYTDEIGNLAAGGTYYVRVAARTDNSLKRYNYSQVFLVTVP